MFCSFAGGDLFKEAPNSEEMKVKHFDFAVCQQVWWRDPTSVPGPEDSLALIMQAAVWPQLSVWARHAWEAFHLCWGGGARASSLSVALDTCLSVRHSSTWVLYRWSDASWLMEQTSDACVTAKSCIWCRFAVESVLLQHCSHPLIPGSTCRIWKRQSVYIIENYPRIDKCCWTRENS